MKARSSPAPITSMQQVLTFGKHKDCSVDYVLQNDPDYILWLHDEHVCKVSKKILDIADAYSEEKQFAEAMDAGWGSVRNMDWGLDFGWDDLF